MEKKGFDDTFKPSKHNPFAKGKPKAEPKKFYKPDPSKKVDCREDRPIKMNPSGKYNLNFIDWQNEFDAVMDCDPDDLEPGESPIYGMDIETFNAISNEESYEERKHLFGVKE